MPSDRPRAAEQHTWGEPDDDFDDEFDDGLDDWDDDLAEPVNGVYSPWTPPRPSRSGPAVGEREPGPPPGPGEFVVQPPPPGLNRRERRDHREREAQRIADLWAAYPARRVNLPRRLGRRGRRAFRDRHKQTMSERRAQQLSATQRERAAGVLIVAVIVAIVLLVRVLFFGDDSSTDLTPAVSPSTAPTTPSAGNAVTGPLTTAGSAAGADPGAPALVAVQTWFAAVCGSSPDFAETARWNSVRGLMTDQAWAAATVGVTDAAPIATWTCSPAAVTFAAEQPTNGDAIVNYSADRTIAPLSGDAPTVVEHIAGARVVVRSPTGDWLIDRIPESDH